MPDLIPAESIERRILLLRGHKVMLDRDLAMLYNVPTRVLNQAVSRNLDRFPLDFMFKLSKEELAEWRSQNDSPDWGTKKGLRHLPRAFTEHGILMLSSVLTSKRSIHVNIEIMRAFVRLRRLLSTQKDLVQKLNALEARYDSQFKTVFQAIRELMEPRSKRKRRIGFTAGAPHPTG